MDGSTLIIRIPQVGGGCREVHAQDGRHAAQARAILRMDPAMVDHLNGCDGIRVRVVEVAAR